jgi:hypothetical protein
MKPLQKRILIMTKEQIERKAELIALGTYLAGYPQEWEFDKILKELLDDSDELWDNIMIWEPFENLCPTEVAVYIENLKGHIVDEFYTKEQS